MNLNKIKKSAHKSYVCNMRMDRVLSHRVIVLFVYIACIIVLTGCSLSSPELSSANITENSNIKTTEAEKEAVETAIARSLEIATHYKELYANAEKITSETYYNKTIISQEVIDRIEILLSEQGYPVVNSDSQYPAYLENSEGVYTFWEAVSENKSAEQELITISATGELGYCLLQYSDGKKYQTGVIVSWSENNEPVVSSNNYMEVLDWDLTENDDFYYQIYPQNRHWDAYALVRLKPMNKMMYDLTEKYISPIGYFSNNMFVFDWSSESYGNLSFNDLFEFFYRELNDDYFYAKDYESVQEPYYYNCIPSSLFEKTLMPYFDISLQEFRERSLYDSDKDIYPWQETRCNNLIYYPTVDPEVVEYKENEDGTFTLIVNARCNDYKTDRLFTHEVVIRPLEDEGFQYLSNKIIYKSETELPPNYPRLPPQRLDSAMQ